MRVAAVALALVGCSNAAVPADASAPPASALPSASVVIAAPTSLARTATPRQRREQDEKACEANDVAACRRAADRHRGYGHIAGCGVDREAPGEPGRPRATPYRMVSAADADVDAERFDKWIRRACDLGDPEACIQGKNNVSGHSISERGIDACTRSRLEDCPLYLWQAGMHPEGADKLAKKRLEYVKSGVSAGLFGDLFRREKSKGGEALPKEVLDLAVRICKSTLECDDVAMMLDKNGWTQAALTPFRKSAAEGLVSACLAGDCVCGEAASYLEPGDARIADLVRIGCEDGEPDACYLLGRASEQTDPKTAVALYKVACPAIVAADGRSEIYSKRACDRLAELAEEGRLVDKDSDSGFFYSTLACTRGGFERDHAPCLRRALYHARGYKGELRWSIMTNMHIARDFFYGVDSTPVHAKECERPSVQAACKRDEPALLKGRVE